MMKNKILTFLLGGLLVLLYIAIFSLSAQDADTSGSLSMDVTKRCVEVVVEISGKEESEAVIEERAIVYEGFVRKFAHFTEYTAMGLLVCLLLALWFVRSKRRMFWNVSWVFLSATLDEFHQVFVSGRHGSIGDVLLDTVGGIFGMFLVYLVSSSSKRYNPSK